MHVVFVLEYSLLDRVRQFHLVKYSSRILGLEVWRTATLMVKTDTVGIRSNRLLIRSQTIEVNSSERMFSMPRHNVFTLDGNCAIQKRCSTYPIQQAEILGSGPPASECKKTYLVWFYVTFTWPKRSPWITVRDFAFKYAADLCCSIRAQARTVPLSPL